MGMLLRVSTSVLFSSLSVFACLLLSVSQSKTCSVHPRHQFGTASSAEDGVLTVLSGLCGS